MRGVVSGWRAGLAVLAAVVVVAAPLPLAASPGDAASDDARLEACARSRVVPLRMGVPVGWQVQTAVNEDASAPWHSAGDTALRGFRIQSDVHGVGAKDDRLVAPSFVATPRTEVAFAHGYVLEAGAGA